MSANERYQISVNENEVSVLDTQNKDVSENLLLFGIDCETTESALQLADELDGLVRLLNEQDKELEYDVV